MTEEPRAIRHEIEVPGTPEQVWQAIATGPGISSWYVPHTLEERLGGSASASFGEAPEMQVPGRVAAWEPPHRLVLESVEGEGGLAFEWLVEARGGACVVRLVNTGFQAGDEWDEQFDGMNEGWRLFLLNLRLHLEHFPGQHASSALPMAMWAEPRPSAWSRLTQALGLPAQLRVGDRVECAAPDAPNLGGVVAHIDAWWLALVLDQPAPGTALVAVEGAHAPVCVSVWSYLYGPDAAQLAARDRARWQDWLDRHAPGA
ncbi:MAG: SRPBCC family protein [Acidimicrobiales bacterium]